MIGRIKSLRKFAAIKVNRSTIKSYFEEAR